MKPMQKLIHLQSFLLLLLLAMGAQAELLLMPEQAVLAPGAKIKLQVYAHNDAVIAGADDFPPQLELVLTADDAAVVTVVAELVQRHARASVASATYQLTLPASLSSGLLEIRNVNQAGAARSKLAFVLIDAQSASLQLAAAASPARPAEQGADSTAGTSEEADLVQIASAGENIDDQNNDEETGRNPFLDNFMAYEPVYFIAGGSPTNAKFQLSFKYRFLHPDSDVAERHPWLTNFYMAYSQTSFWDLSSESIPFTDTNFKPELFYQFNDVRFNFLPESAYTDLRTGIQHESNGEDEDRSRSLNIAYLEPAMHFRFGDKYLFSLTPKVWAYVGSKVDNADIRRFRGNNSLTATINKRDSWQLETMLRGNIGTGRGALQMDLSYPVNQFIPGLDLYLYSQFFTGFGENLLNYNVKDTRLRFGIGILR